MPVGIGSTGMCRVALSWIDPDVAAVRACLASVRRTRSSCSANRAGNSERRISTRLRASSLRCSYGFSTSLFAVHLTTKSPTSTTTRSPPTAVKMMLRVLHELVPSVMTAGALVTSPGGSPFCCRFWLMMSWSSFFTRSLTLPSVEAILVSTSSAAASRARDSRRRADVCANETIST